MKRSWIKRGTKPIYRVNVARSRKRKLAYAARLKRRDWQLYRGQVLQMQCYGCAKCGASIGYEVGFQLHHKTYARFGNERLSDLEALCVPCHEKAHERDAWKNQRRRMIA